MEPNMNRRVTASPKSTGKRDDELSTDVYDQPGHLIRRAQQIAVSMFYVTMGSDVTPVQYAALRTLQDHPGIDQITLARFCALDTSTAADLAVRLEERGLVKKFGHLNNEKSRAPLNRGSADLQSNQATTVEFRRGLRKRQA